MDGITSGAASVSSVRQCVCMGVCVYAGMCVCGYAVSSLDMLVRVCVGEEERRRGGQKKQDRRPGLEQIMKAGTSLVGVVPTKSPKQSTGAKSTCNTVSEQCKVQGRPVESALGMDLPPARLPGGQR